MVYKQQPQITSYSSFNLVNFVDGRTAYTQKVDIKEISLENGLVTIRWRNPDPFFIKNIQLEFMQFATSPTFNPSFSKHEWSLLSRDAKEYKKMIEYGYECMLSIAFIDHDGKWFAHEVSHIVNIY
uniref:Fibronectin type-III domain-containing protein n=1 Tax=Strongyloides papillosus TaxID=174720 RepID=A0A0N5CEE3_STREA